MKPWVTLVNYLENIGKVHVFHEWLNLWYMWVNIPVPWSLWGMDTHHNGNLRIPVQMIRLYFIHSLLTTIIP